jgi:hypothetical protein
MKPALRLVAAILILGWQDSSSAQPVSREHAVVVRELIGHSPLEVQRRLVGLEIDWPRPMDFEITTRQGVLSFATLEEHLRDPGSSAFQARSRTRAEGPPMSQTSCRNTAQPYGTGLLLIYRNGKLDGVLSPSDLGLGANAYPASDKLPLEDGDALSHWRITLVDTRTELIIQCTTLQLRREPRPRRQSGQEFLSASDMQGLALLPFAVTLPFMNSTRSRHKRAGTALYNQLAPGYRLPGGLRAFLRMRSGVAVINGSTPGYAILRINMGGEPTRNLSNFEDFGLVGVRNDRVEWRSLEYSPASPQLPVRAHR